MKILVVGGTGHIGSYLVPRLILAGHAVTVVARNPKPQYAEERLTWGQVAWLTADRREEEASQAWARRMADIEADIVIDLICFTPKQNHLMVEAFRDRVAHFLHCGTIWAYGPTERSPYQEHYPRRPNTQYGIDKTQIEVDLVRAYREEGFPATIVHPGHISGRRWLPIDPQGSRDGVGVYGKLARGEEVPLPDLGLATLHHVHADDVAQIFQCAIQQRERALGESFSAVAPYAMSLVGCCRCVAALFGQEPNLRYVPREELRALVGDTSYEIIDSHITHSPCSSLTKPIDLLGHSPRYTTEEIYAECVEYLLESGQLRV